ncbi:MAG: peptidylprolyl isomerase [Methylomicrobium sp.]
MLTKIREKAQGVFAWVILVAITVPFALWGIQNYLDVGKETPVASVGDKDFFQRDVAKAYAQFSQGLQGLDIDEETLKKQALQKLIQDEVLLQHVQSEGLSITDDTARDFIKGLDYFLVDGKFDKKQYEALLRSQGMSSIEFVGRIKNALMMEQFQRAIVNSGFATQYDVESFFKIQNQQRDIEYLTVPVKSVSEQPSDEEIEAFYRQNQDKYRTPEQVSVDYVELSLQALADAVEVDDDKLRAFYEDQKDLFSTKERRKISHILFAVTEQTDDTAALDKAKSAKERLNTEDFAKLAEEVSDDKLTAKSGGDLGLFEAGVMEKAFEEAASSLQLGEVSEPVRSAFGYHLIKVTELIPGTTKAFGEVKDEVKEAYQRSEAENKFYELGQTLAELSYENPDNLLEVSDALGLKIQSTDLFGRDKGDDIAAEEKVRQAAFSEEVLKGNNSEPLELEGDRLLVLRVKEHIPAAVRELSEVKKEVTEAWLANKSRQQAEEKAQALKKRVLAGETLQQLSAETGLERHEIKGLSRSNTDLPFQLVKSVFTAAKPVADKPTVFVAALNNGEQVLVSLHRVTEGEMTEDDKKRLDLATKNIANALGQSLFSAVIANLQEKADIKINMP